MTSNHFFRGNVEDVFDCNSIDCKEFAHLICDPIYVESLQLKERDLRKMDVLALDLHFLRNLAFPTVPFSRSVAVLKRLGPSEPSDEALLLLDRQVEIREVLVRLKHVAAHKALR